MQRFLLLRLLSPGLLAVCIPCQLVHHPDGHAGTGARNSFPFGKQGIRYQQILPGSLLPPGSTVQDLFIAPYGSMVSPYTSGEIVYGDIEIRMGCTPLASVGTSWSANNPNPVVVHRGRLRQRWQRDTWTPIGLEQAFPWNPARPGDNLCLEIIVWNVQSSGNLPYVPAFFTVRTGAVPRAFHPTWTSYPSSPPQVTAGDGIKVGLLLDRGNFVGRGEGCPGAGGVIPALAPQGRPRLGATFTVDVSGLSGGALAIPFVGFDEVGGPGASYPFALGAFGAPACVLWHDVVVVLPAVTGGATTAGVPMAIPRNTVFMAARLRMSAVVLDPAARGGIAGTDYALLIVGT